MEANRPVDSNKEWRELHAELEKARRELIIANEKNQLLAEELISVTEDMAASNEELSSTIEELASTNEELASTNEELASTNEELTAANESFSQSQLALDALNKNLERMISERTQDLAKSEQRLKSVVESAPFPIAVYIGREMRIFMANQSITDVWGKGNDVIGKTYAELLPELSDQGIYEKLDSVYMSGIPYHARNRKINLVVDGVSRSFYFNYSFTPLFDEYRRVYGVMNTAADVTDLNLAKMAIADAEERNRLAVAAAEIGTYEHDLVTGELRASDRHFEIFGFDHPVPRSQLLDMIHPEDRAMATRYREEGYKTGNLFYEARMIHPDGSIRWFRAQGKVYYDEHRNPLRLLGTVLDITEFKRLQQQKDDFISIASHELKTPITSLKAALQLLDRLKDNPTATAVPKLIEQANRSMGKISELVEDLLNVSRMNEGQMRLNKVTFNVSELLVACCSDVRAIGRHELVFKGNENLTVYADEHRIDQVVVNFVNNAVKYAPDSKQIYLLAEARGENIWIGVRDTGAGVPMDKLPHLFDRYYRADESGFQVSGLGLGLYISAEIIKRHGGEIGVDSEVGKGSTFWFTIPRA